jgi:hypothetical protein
MVEMKEDRVAREEKEGMESGGSETAVTLKKIGAPAKFERLGGVAPPTTRVVR